MIWRTGGQLTIKLLTKTLYCAWDIWHRITYENYTSAFPLRLFLLVHDLVVMADSEDILCEIISLDNENVFDLLE